MKKTLRIASYGRCAEDVKDGPRLIYLRADLEYFYSKERNQSLVTYDDKYNYADAEIFGKAVTEILKDLEKYSGVMVILPKNCKKSFLNYFRSVRHIDVFDVDAVGNESVAYVASRGNYSRVALQKKSFWRLLEKLFPFWESSESKELKRHVDLLAKIGDLEGGFIVKKVEHVREVLDLITESDFVLN